MLWCYILFTVPFFLQDRRERVLKAATLTEFSLNYLRGRGGSRIPGTALLVHLQNELSRDVDNLTEHSREL